MKTIKDFLGEDWGLIGPAGTEPGPMVKVTPNRFDKGYRYPPHPESGKPQTNSYGTPWLGAGAQLNPEKTFSVYTVLSHNMPSTAHPISNKWVGVNDKIRNGMSGGFSIKDTDITHDQMKERVSHLLQSRWAKFGGIGKNDDGENVPAGPMKETHTPIEFNQPGHLGGYNGHEGTSIQFQNKFHLGHYQPKVTIITSKTDHTIMGGPGAEKCQHEIIVHDSVYDAEERSK